MGTFAFTGKKILSSKCRSADAVTSCHKNAILIYLQLISVAPTPRFSHKAVRTGGLTASSA